MCMCVEVVEPQGMGYEVSSVTVHKRTPSLWNTQGPPLPGNEWKYARHRITSSTLSLWLLKLWLVSLSPHWNKNPASCLPAALSSDCGLCGSSLRAWFIYSAEILGNYLWHFSDKYIFSSLLSSGLFRSWSVTTGIVHFMCQRCSNSSLFGGKIRVITTATYWKFFQNQRGKVSQCWTLLMSQCGFI